MVEWLYGPFRTAALEALVFGSSGSAALRAVMSLVLRPRLELLRDHFEEAFYLLQFAEAGRRARVQRAPLLHYVLIGWREDRSPSPDFDPIQYRASNAGARALGDPLRHYLMVGRYAGARRHECDGVARVTGDTGGGAVLTFNHARGGGSSRYLDLFEEQLVQGGHAVLRLRAVHKAPTLGVIHDPGNHPDGMHARCFDLAGDRQALEDFARRRQVGRLLVNHWVDRPKEAMTWVKDLADRLGCPYDIVLHDYYCVCPRINLVDSEGRFCGLPEIDVCNACVQKGGADIAVSPAEWRRAVQEFIAGAAKVIVPSADCAQRLRRLLPKEPVVWEPESDEDLPPENTPSVSANEPLRVAVLGAVNVPKGLSLLADVATRARASAAPLSFRVIGPASDPELLRKAGIPVSGPYPPQELDGLLASWTPHMVFLPAIWPETWSFVLSTALRHALPVATFALGAPADRLRRLGRGHVFPVAWTDRPDEVLQALLSLRAGWLKRC